MDLLELIENIRSEEADVQRLFGGEGRRASSVRSDSASYNQKLVETLKFLADIQRGRRPAYMLREAMTTSDFPLLFGDILDRQVLSAYRETPQTFRSYCKIATVRDFRQVKRFAVSGAESVLAPVAEQAEYPDSKLNERDWTYRVQKYGRRLPISWETLINDDLQVLTDFPGRLGRAARRSEEKFATQLFVGASGPNSTLYTAGNKNIITGNPALTIEGLQTAFQSLASQVDEEGEPILIDQVHLVVPPALEIQALNILNAIQMEISTGGGTSNQKLTAVNWMRNRVQLHVNAYIPIVASTANGNTSWFLFADPNNGRPALEVGFLVGHTDPEIFIKEPNARRVGGGVNPLDGDFDTDSIEYKLRHVFGGTQLDPKMTVASNGTGS